MSIYLHFTNFLHLHTYVYLLTYQHPLTYLCIYIKSPQTQEPVSVLFNYAIPTAKHFSEERVCLAINAGTIVMTIIKYWERQSICK